MHRPTVLLFDIDGTLITTGGAARRALEDGVAAYLGLDSFAAEFSFGGMTDRGIMRGSLRQAGAEASEERIDEVMSFYLERLPGVLTQSGVYQAHEGVHAMLEAVTAAEHCSVGLGTGNVEIGARLKLDSVGLNPYFSFGGFGCDAEPRDELILAGAKRGAAKLGAHLDECRVIIIGDTVRDVDAAHANGFECVAVSTGGTSHESLAETQTELLVTSLTDPDALRWLLR